MGPSEFLLGSGMDVRPHPHTGLATITYLVDGEIMHRDSLGTELPIQPGDRITIRARSAARFMLLDGEAMDGPRYVWLNFVSSRQDRIEQAKGDWKAARFDTVPGDEAAFTPLPEALPPRVRYP